LPGKEFFEISFIVSKSITVEFALTAKAKGRPVTPGAIPFSLFSDFNDDVKEFIIGAEKSRVLQEVEVSIHEGSYLLRAVVPAGILSALVSDLGRLQSPDSLSQIEPKRATIIERWQERARYDDSISVIIRSQNGSLAPIVVDKGSQFRRLETEQWIAVERYLVGEITDWGGAHDVNVHLRLRDTRKIITIDAIPEQIKTQRENLVLHRAVVHVKGEQNLCSGELRNLRLIDLRPHEPKVDEAAMREFVEEGTKAWADVTKAGLWVEEQRGETPNG
jgi:hypothetical protein